jgi:hypothetical protein
VIVLRRKTDGIAARLLLGAGLVDRRQVLLEAVFQFLLEKSDHVLLNHDALLVEILNDKVVVGAVDVDDDGLDGGIAFDQDTCRRLGLARGGSEMVGGGGVAVPLMARGMLTVRVSFEVEWAGERVLLSRERKEEQS